jgi:hypothetical protein
MKQLILFLTTTIIFMGCSSEPQKMSMETCLKFTEKFNKKLPNGNQQSILYSSFCSDGPEIHYAYRNAIPVPDSHKDFLVGLNCTSSRLLLESVEGLIYTYYDASNGKTLNKFRVSLDDCDINIK